MTEYLANLIRANTITGRVPDDVKDILFNYCIGTLCLIPDDLLCGPTQVQTVIKQLNLDSLHKGDRHCQKELKGLVSMMLIGEFLRRHSDQELHFLTGLWFTEDGFCLNHPDIANEAYPHLSAKFEMANLVSVWRTFLIATHVMQMSTSGTKSSLLVAANLLADPTHAMTTGSRAVMRTTLALKVFGKVTGKETSTRKKRSNSDVDTSDSEDDDHYVANKKKSTTKRARKVVKAPKGASRSSSSSVASTVSSSYTIESVIHTDDDISSIGSPIVDFANCFNDEQGDCDLSCFDVIDVADEF